MGIVDFFRRRRERESALAPDAIEELTGAADPATGGGEASAAGSARPAAASHPGAGTELPGADPGGFGAMIRQALLTGQAQISTESHTVDLSGGGLRDELLGILGGHGIEGDGERGIDAAEVPGPQEEILEALRRAGIDLGDGEGDEGRGRG